MELQALTRPELIFPELPGTDRVSVLWAMAERVATEDGTLDAHQIFEKLLEREELGSTSIGCGVAVPHCKVKHLERVVVAIGVLNQGIEYDTKDGAPVRLLFLVLSPESAPAAHLKSLAAISKWVQGDSHVERILEQPDRDRILTMLREEESVQSGD